MADQYLRIGGRGDDGLAKPIRTNNDGDQYVQLTGRNIEDDTTGNLTFVQDESGNSVIRVVDAAPYALEEESGQKQWRVRSTSKVEAVVATREIRDTTALFVDWNTEKYSKALLQVKNTLTAAGNPVDVWITLRFSTLSTMVYDSETDAWVEDNTSKTLATIPSNNKMYVMNTFKGDNFKLLSELTGSFLRMRIQASGGVAPDAGSVEIRLDGVPLS